MTSPDGARRRVGLTGARGVLGRSLQTCGPDVDWIAFPGDVEESDEVAAWLDAAGSLDGLCHLAALVPTHVVDQNPSKAIRTNVEGTANILEAVRRRSAVAPRPWVFVSSSSHVYATSERPLVEDSALAPSTLYGLTKLQAETWARAYQARFGLNVCVGRIFSYTSRWQPATYVIPALVRRIAEAPKDGIIQVPGLLGSRDFLTARHVTAAIQTLFARRATGVFNIASGKATRILDIATAIRDRLGRTDVRIIPLEGETTHLTADVTKLRSEGVTLECSVNDLLDEVLGDGPASRLSET